MYLCSLHTKVALKVLLLQSPLAERDHPLQCILEASISMSSASGVLNPALHPMPCDMHASRTEETPRYLPTSKTKPTSNYVLPPIFSELTARSVQVYHHPLRSKQAGLRSPARESSLSSTICTAWNPFYYHLSQNPGAQGNPPTSSHSPVGSALTQNNLGTALTPSFPNP